MTKTNPNDPAFPSHGTMGEVCYGGMTKREIFAKDLTAALLSNTDITFRERCNPFDHNEHPAVIFGIKLADTLIKKLNEGADKGEGE